MKKSITIVLVCFVLSVAKAQNYYGKILYYETSRDLDSVNIKIINPVSTHSYAKFEVRINNRNKEIVLFNPSESSLKIDDKDYKTEVKSLSVSKVDKSRTVVFKGSDFLVENFTYELNGLYKVSTDATVIKFNDIEIPSLQKGFNSGEFSCEVLNVYKINSVEVRLECLYSGDKMGVIYPDSSVIKLSDGREVASALKNATPIVFRKGERKNVKLYWKRLNNGDKINFKKADIKIVWYNTFCESEAIKFEPITFTLEKDQKATSKEQRMKTMRSMSIMVPH